MLDVLWDHLNFSLLLEQTEHITTILRNLTITITYISEIKKQENEKVQGKLINRGYKMDNTIDIQVLGFKQYNTEWLITTAQNIHSNQSRIIWSGKLADDAQEA